MTLLLTQSADLDTIPIILSFTNLVSFSNNLSLIEKDTLRGDLATGIAPYFNFMLHFSLNSPNP